MCVCVYILTKLYTRIILVVFPLLGTLWFFELSPTTQYLRVVYTHMHPKYVYTTAQVVNHAPYYYHVTETNLPVI
jgi:hypothetical protein